MVSSSAVASRSADPFAAVSAIASTVRNDARGRVEHALSSTTTDREDDEDQTYAGHDGSARQLLRPCARSLGRSLCQCRSPQRVRLLAPSGPDRVVSPEEIEQPPADRERTATTTTARMRRTRWPADSPSSCPSGRCSRSCLTHRLVDDQREHRRGRLARWWCWCRPCRRSRAARVAAANAHSSLGCRAAGSLRPTTRRGGAITSAIASTVVAKGHFPRPPPSQRPRAVQDAHAGMVDAADAVERVGLRAHDLDGVLSRGGLLGDPRGERGPSDASLRRRQRSRPRPA